MFSLPHPKVKGDVVRLKLDLPGAGRVVVVETFSRLVKGKIKHVRFARVSAKVGGGAKNLTIKPSRAGVAEIKKIARSRKLAVTVAVTFTPTGGKPHTEHLKLKLKGQK